ncbi:MAG: thymidylate kinase [Patescibacteria group bacterium]
MSNLTKQGKFIVIDGGDGSGKATQTDLMFKRLSKEKIKVKKIDFPQYQENFFGQLIRECLDGKYGDFLAVPPQIASVLYAADRWETSAQIKKWLAEGYVVMADRYTSANQIHQGGKISNQTARKKFLTWLDKMEFGVFKIPRPDMILYLHVPVAISQSLLANRAAENKKTKSGRAKKDLAESNIKHLEDSQKSAIDIVRKNNAWIRIDCAKSGQILPREEIHEMIYGVIKAKIKINN